MVWSNRMSFFDLTLKRSDTVFIHSGGMESGQSGIEHALKLSSVIRNNASAS
jgi:hypothetical protein